MSPAANALLRSFSQARQDRRSLFGVAQGKLRLLAGLESQLSVCSGLIKGERAGAAQPINPVRILDPQAELAVESDLHFLEPIILARLEVDLDSKLSFDTSDLPRDLMVSDRGLPF